LIASKVIFWMCLGVLTYTYAGYPLLVLLLGCLRRHPKRTDVGEPSVALIIVARNEAGSIERRIRNGLALDYPKDRLRIIVCSDGSTDGTDDIVAECADNRVLLLRVEPQRGQSYCQAQAIGHTEADVIVFSDANTRFDRGSLRHLVEPFGTKGVGCVV
jgi:cellulose synthase/poly-beta-1,6-N-acetylglucosamine synthase-like glycosyltransferase